MLPRLAIACVVAVPLAGCGSTTIVKTVTAPASQEAATTATDDAAPQTAPAAERSEPRDARLGDTLDLDVSDTTLAIRPLEVIDPLPVGDYDEPDAGMRYVGLRLSIRNTGDVAYADSLSNGSTLIVQGDEQADSTIVGEGPCGSSFGSDLKLAPGDKRVGCIPFEVPAGRRLRTFQFTGDSGFADATGEWRLPSRAPGAADSTSGSEGSDVLGTSEPEVRSGGFTSCDANIEARSGSTTCAFAQNVFYEYFVSGESSDVSAYSPAAGRSFDLACSSDGSDVDCESEDGGGVRFPESAVQSYSSSQAAAYAASHDVG